METFTTEMLSLSNIIDKHPSTYEGELDFSRDDEGWIQNYIDEGRIPDSDSDNQINFDDLTYFEIKGLTLWDSYIPEIQKAFSREILETHCINMKLTKFGVKIVKVNFHRPREYNFTNDSVDIKLEITKDLRKKYQKEIQNYIDNIRQKSYDGYHSYEPSELGEVELDDYAYIHTIFTLADVIEDAEGAFDSAIENLNEKYSNLFTEYLYTWLETVPFYNKWLKEKKYKEWIKQNNTQMAV